MSGQKIRVTKKEGDGEEKDDKGEKKSATQDKSGVAGQEEEEEEEEDEKNTTNKQESDEEDNKPQNPQHHHPQQSGVIDLDIFSNERTSGPNNSNDLFPKQDMEKLQILYTKPSGVLYETKGLQIGVKVVHEPGQCKMILYYGNRTNDVLSNVSAVLPDSAALRIQVKPDAPFDVKPSEQVLHLFMWEITRPFTEQPLLKIQFSHDDTPQMLSFRMPILTSHYVKPKFDGNFVDVWKSTTQNELMQTLRAPSVINAEGISAVLADFGMNMVIIPNVETNPLNVYAAGTFIASTKDKNGNMISMPVLARVETRDNLNVFRVTIHSGHKSLSEAIMASFTIVMNAVIFQPGKK